MDQTRRTNFSRCRNDEWQPQGKIGSYKKIKGVCFIPALVLTDENSENTHRAIKPADSGLTRNIQTRSLSTEQNSGSALTLLVFSG